MMQAGNLLYCKHRYEKTKNRAGDRTMQKRTLYFIIGGVVLALIVIGIGVFVLLPTITSANAGSVATATPTVIATPKGNGVAKIVKQYTPEIKNQVAQSLHMTADQLTAQLQAGQTLSAIATAQKVSSTQLQTIVANAIQTALQPAVDSGQLTSKQVSNLVKRYQNNPQQLDRLLGAKASPKATPTPTLTPGQ
jgi:hypothetical protein